MPLPLSTAAMPSKPTSVAVSNPSPKNTPIGYIFQLRSTMRNSGPNIRPSKPPNARNTSARTNALRIAIANKNAAETEVPMMLPAFYSCGRSRFTYAAATAIATVSASTMVEWPSEKKNPGRDRTPAVRNNMREAPCLTATAAGRTVRMRRPTRRLNPISTEYMRAISRRTRGDAWSTTWRRLARLNAPLISSA
jgi:hypothetical protein